eukprot:gene7889-8742_t
MVRRVEFIIIAVLSLTSVSKNNADKSCTVFEFKCANQKCILKNWLCDRDDDCGDGSDERNCAGKVPGPPRDVKARPISETSAHVTWVPPEKKANAAEPILYYTLRYRHTSSQVVTEMQIASFRNFISLRDLIPSASYTLSLSAVNIIGRGVPSDSVIINLNRSVEAAVSLKAKATNSTSISVSWSVVDEKHVAGYFLQITPLIEKNASKTFSQATSMISLPNGTTEYLIDKKILPATTYAINLQFYMKYGFGQRVGPVYVTTPKMVPSPPSFNVSTQKDGANAFLSIQPSLGTKGYLLRFGRALTKSFPMKEERVIKLPGDFKGGEITLKPFYWHFIALSRQTSSGRWSHEKSVWVRGPFRGFKSVPSSNSILIMWRGITNNDKDDYVVSFKKLPCRDCLETDEEKAETRLFVKRNLKRGFTTLTIAKLSPSTVYGITISYAKSSCRETRCYSLHVKTLQDEKCKEECKFHSKCQTNKDGISKCSCNMKCLNIASPVCASDGNNYYNLCTMKKTSCLKKERITLKYRGICVNKCGRHKFKCRNSKCILQRFMCDGYNDCNDNSDEAPELCDMLVVKIGFAVLLLAAFVFGQTDWKCSSGNFRCANQKCIPNAWRCDSENDCGDNSDETGCEKNKCSDNQFKCDSGRCIRSNWRCDGDNDCGQNDSSDEKDCGLKNVTCAANQFTCKSNKRCIPKAWRCDHDNDCGDNSDEQNCNHSTCAGSSFTCNNKKCIDVKWKCDQDNDCGDGSDEDPKQCPARSCKSGQFTCNNQKCIQENWKCDGEDDCSDNSDEEDSVCSKKPTYTCKQGEIPCRSSNTGLIGRCILRSWRCDGERDCNDGSDEEGCTVKPACKSTEFNCSRGVCIDLSKKCDAKKDCPGGEDELDCAHRCADDQFLCKHSKQCIPENQVCNKNKDCYHGEDEPLSCGANECAKDNGHCSQICINEKIGFKCSCRPGYQLEEDGRTCQDLNECSILGLCSQLCQNTKGSFKCSCLPTYLLEPDGRSCKAIGQRPFLIFSDRHNLRSLSLDGDKMQEIAADLDGVIGVSYDSALESVYWADVKKRKIQSAALNNPDVIHTVARLKNRSVPDAVAIDWIARKIYWSDAGLDVIEVSELDGSSSLVLIDTGLDEPRAIAIDPTEAGRHIYWTDWGQHAKIEKMSMDGELATRQILHHLNGSWPNGLTIDFTTSRIFWTDAKLKVIESSTLDGRDRRIILRVPTQHPFSISVFEDVLYWADWTNEAIHKANKFTGKDHSYMIRNVFDVMGVAIYHPLRQPTAKNPCEPYNGGCSHLCLLSSRYHYTCMCPTGVSMLHDGQTCNTTSAYVCTPAFCLNGGECVNETSKRYSIRRCKCPHGFTGRRCEQVNRPPTKSPPVLLPSTKPRLKSNSDKKKQKEEDMNTTIGMVIGVVVAILIVAGGCVYLFYRRLRKNYRGVRVILIRERKAISFDNPVYRRTTEDSMPIMETTFDEDAL